MVKILAGAAAIPIAIVIAIAIVFMIFFAGDPQQTPAAATSCTPAAGGGLRPGSVPNGWDADILAAASSAGIDPAILAAQLEAESGWDANATSGAGAQGLAQFMPGTWQAYGQGDPFDPHAAIAAQGVYMKTLKDSVAAIAQSTGADAVHLALAAYNAGPGAVEKYQGVPPYNETQKYVTKIADLAQSKFRADCQPAGAAPAPQPDGGAWTHPLPGSVLTSPYGPRWGVLHAGIDLSTPGHAGTEVAITAMTITWAGCKSDGYGCSVVGVANDGSGYMFRYGHMAEGTVAVATGQQVGAGTALGTEGATGDVTGRHLHLEIYNAGVPQNGYASSGFSTDPIPILIAHGVSV
ncbi:murein DD-endopeptidase MepM/ murein hydrolase activator NlpD [Antricoccus suffuscus]|uniref:Murein DD-endopeptidase MepM/ murein hydrolase activator NlpD n=1 Tax=Antricoccus suffuscus TaxID=1629062 RepID=A0A2T0ZEN2_9ACTN|nr:transglycosylase SLT domain-containing protein [Antricoccus suffuscus]PRZ34806.1 murein DD-endopeptidase MepM/ murein hydrolase activator NlpD [Antricoccus suffuscus]